MSALPLQMELESVKPDSGNEELRLKVSALPLRVRIDQDVVAFMQAFFAQEEDDLASEPVALEPEASPAAVSGKATIDLIFRNNVHLLGAVLQ